MRLPAARPACSRASSTPTARSRSTRSPRSRCSASTRATPSSPSCRCSTRTRGALFSCTMVGAKQVFPGPHLDPQSSPRRVRRGGGHGQRGRADDLDGDPAGARRESRRLDLSRMRTMTVGGAAAAGDDRGVQRASRAPHHARLGDDRDVSDRDDLGRARPGARPSKGPPPTTRAQQGPPILFVEIRARGEAGLVPWDGESMGELEVRGPSISSAYYESPDSADRWTEDGVHGPATSSRSDATATSRFRIARRTSSSRAASGSRRSRSRTRLHGPPRRRRGRRDRGAGREVVGASTRGRRPPRGRRGRPRRAARLPRAELREVLAAGPVRVRRRDPEDRRRQVPQDRLARAFLRPPSRRRNAR